MNLMEWGSIQNFTSYTGEENLTNIGVLIENFFDHHSLTMFLYIEFEIEYTKIYENMLNLRIEKI